MLARIKHTFSMLAVLALFNLAATAGLGQQQLPSSSPIVTAASSGNVVRFSAAGNITHIRLEVFSAAGERVFDSGQHEGNLLDWRWQDEKAPAFNADRYLCVVTVQSLSGKTSRKLANLSFANQQASLKAIEVTQLNPVQAQVLGVTETDTPLTIIDGDQTIAATVIAHDGNDGQVSRTRGAFSFRFGDFFSGNDKEQMRLTEEGNLGIGTSEPKAKLDVAGTIRARAGFLFSDGSTLNVNDKGALTLTNSNGNPVPNAAGSGTQDRLAKWTDNSGTLGDSVITESAGNIGVGTSSPGASFEVQQPSSPTVPNMYLSQAGTPSKSVFQFLKVGANTWSYFGHNVQFNGTANVLLDPAKSGWAFYANGDVTDAFYVYSKPPTGGDNYPLVLKRDGRLKLSSGNFSPPGNNQLEVQVQNPAYTGTVIKGAAAQSASLQEWQNSTGAVLSKFDSSGNLSVGTATSPTGGVATFNGNVGINTLAPTERLHVTGNGLFTGNLTVKGTLNATLPATSVSGVLPIENGGTGSSTKNFIDLSTNQTNIGGDKTFTGSVGVTGAGGVFNGNGSGLTNLNGSNVTGAVANATTATNVSGVVAIDNGGTGSATQNFVDLSKTQIIHGKKTFFDPIFGDGSFLTNLSGSNVTGTVANATTATNVSGVVAIANGGTGSSTQNFVDLATDQTVGGNKAFTGTLSGNGSGLTNIPGTINWQIVSGLSQQALPNTGYLVTNDAQVTITLPASPKVGDIVRISGIGAGGWRLMQNDGQFVVGGTNLNSAADWTPHLPSGPWESIASSADGMKLVVCGYDSNFIGKIYTSTDFGVTWTQRDIARQWRAVASSDDGTNLVAVVAGGLIYTSFNSGESWKSQLFNSTWRGVASSNSGSKLAAVNVSAVYTSDDGGETWKPHGFSNGLESVASSALGDKLVAVGFGQQIYTSTDSGANWTPRETSRQWKSVASSADGSKLVAVVEGGLIYTSTDSGVTWTPRETSRSWHSVASSADGSRLVATVLNGQIYVSTDFGNSWAPHAFATAWEAVASSADGTRLVAAVYDGQIYTSAQNTTFGTEGYLTGGQFTSLELQYIGNGKFLPLSHEGTIVGH